jgi:septal ring factor EnvC (AmiA/AmiB activator)
MRLVVVVLVLAACAPQKQVRRWPEHRRQKDARIEVLERQSQDLATRLTALEAELARLRTASAAAPAAPAEVPSPPQ